MQNNFGYSLNKITSNCIIKLENSGKLRLRIIETQDLSLRVINRVREISTLINRKAGERN